jgi:hypothetical protein
MAATTATLPGTPSSQWPRVGWVLLLLGAVLASGHALLFATVPAYNVGGLG